MYNADVQRLLIAYLRFSTPITYRYEKAALRRHFVLRLRRTSDTRERAAIGRIYRSAKASLVTRLAWELSRDFAD